MEAPCLQYICIVYVLTISVMMIDKSKKSDEGECTQEEVGNINKIECILIATTKLCLKLSEKSIEEQIL